MKSAQSADQDSEMGEKNQREDRLFQGRSQSQRSLWEQTTLASDLSSAAY